MSCVGARARVCTGARARTSACLTKTYAKTSTTTLGCGCSLTPIYCCYHVCFYGFTVRLRTKMFSEKEADPQNQISLTGGLVSLLHAQRPYGTRSHLGWVRVNAATMLHTVTPLYLYLLLLLRRRRAVTGGVFLCFSRCLETAHCAGALRWNGNLKCWLLLLRA